ncbi:MAG: ImmA/IrrE family metallo-endopeptidase [bacterium]|nr:ImmA/IrrE family metallo-endopeptidase [bacterium]
MTRLEELQQESDDCGVEVVDWRFSGNIKGLYCDGSIALDERLTNSERAGILAEELGHYHTTSGDILNQSDVMNRKQEHRARAWAYQRLLPFYKLLEAHVRGCRNRFEMAEYLEVSEEFLQDAVDYYSR